MNNVARLVTLVLLAAALSSCAILGGCPPSYEPVTLESGVVLRDVVVPIEGQEAAVGDLVRVHYELNLADGTAVDSSYERGQPLETTLGAGLLPPGIEEGIVGMRVFGRRTIEVPPAMGYGETGMGDRVPPNSRLLVRLELMGIGPVNLEP